MTQLNQPTFVQFVSSGLSKNACIAWRQISKDDRTLMTWDIYSAWIQNTFGSTLTLDQALDTMDDLRQTTSAVIYSAKFNELVSAISAADVDYSQKHLCSHYRRGLKPHLRATPDLIHIKDNLKALQQETKQLDDITFRAHKTNCKTSSTPRISNSQSFRSTQGHSLKNSFPETSDPMDLGNTQQTSPYPRLTQDQKAHFHSKGWCVYCQAKDHNTDHCPKLRACQAQLAAKSTSRINNAATQAQDEEEDSDNRL
ncbi:hypothetical protein HDU81_001629 [Chytriomyces hyalinus]|nr:hypothetical protein HDU81_001629 [Chytriomyces hyalinus]